MTPPALNKLVSLLDPVLRPLTAKGNQQRFLSTKAQVMIVLCMYRGLPYLDQERKHGVAKATVFKCMKRVAKAICKHPDIRKPAFPNSTDSCGVHASKWAKLSGPMKLQRELLTGCVGALDGLFVRTTCLTQGNQEGA